MSIHGKLYGVCMVILISSVLPASGLADTVKIYDLALSGQVHRSRFHGLAGEVSSLSPLDGLKIIAKGKLTLGEEIIVEGDIRTTGIFLLQLPEIRERQWSVSLREGDKVIAGPVSVEVIQPGVGLDWKLSSNSLDQKAQMEIERDAKLNRTVAKEILKAAPLFPANIVAGNTAESPIRRPSSFKILEPGDSAHHEPQRLARDVDRLEDETLIGLAEKLQNKEWSDRIVQKIGKLAERLLIHAGNGATGYETVDLHIQWKGEKSLGSLFIRVAKLDQATLESNRTGSLLRDHSRSVAPNREERLVGYNGMYYTWGSNSGVLALWKDYHLTINLTSSDATLISQESLTGFLALILEGM